VSASPPPPPPYASGSPARPTSAWERRNLREQRRVAALQAKQQRTLQRAQLRAMRRTSVLGPVLLLSAGVVFLLLETGKLDPPEAVSWFARWWPLVLVSAGFVLLLEWALDSFVAARRTTSPPVRHLGAGTALLLTVLLVAGIAAMAAGDRSDLIPKHWNPEFVDSLGLDQVFAQHREVERDLSAPMAAGTLLRIQNYRGNISVTGSSEDGLVHVTVHQHLVGWRNEELRSKEDRDQPTFVHGGDGLLLRVNGEGKDRTDLTIEVPHQAGLQISGEHGDITLSELRGPVTVADHVGNVSLSALTGDVHLTSSDDNAAISGHSLTGQVSVMGRTGDVALSDLTGPVTLQGDFFGTTHLERVKGPVHFRSSYTDFSCAGVPGEVNVEGRSELEASNLDGPVVLTTSDRNLALTDVRNGATVRNRNGSVSLALASPLGTVNITNRDGLIDLRVPENAGFVLSARTVDGEVSNDLGLSTKRQADSLLLEGHVRTGGPTLTLNTANGDITVHRSTDAGNDEPSDKSND
jgi:DUF4097 and DUF4098 domain-containing protein YvlB